MEKLVIIDYSTTSVHFFDIETTEDIDIEELGFKESQCSWMFSEEMEIIHHKNPIK